MATGPPGPAPAGVRSAAFTMVRDESFFLPIWLGYYSRHFRDLVILDHLTADGSVERAAERFSFRRVRLDYPYFLDTAWVSEVAQQTQRELLRDHDVVLYTDPDEILWHEAGLGRYVEGFARDAVRATGWQVVQAPDEGPLDPGRPVLGQRRMWRRDPLYDKPLLARVPLNWAAGFHHALRAEGPCHDPAVLAQGYLDLPRDGGLLLLHLHYADLDRCRAKNARNVTYPLPDVTLTQGLGKQCWVTGAELEDLLRRVSAAPGEPIPEALRRDPPV